MIGVKGKMNVSDFISRDEYESYCKNTLNEKPFSVEKVVKVNGNKYTLLLRANKPKVLDGSQIFVVQRKVQ